MNVTASRRSLAEARASRLPDKRVSFSGCLLLLLGALTSGGRSQYRSPGVSWEYGSGCSGTSATVPTLSARTLPNFGQRFTLDVTRAAASRPAMLWLGASPLNLQFGLNAPGCAILTSNELLNLGLMTDALGSIRLPMTLPVAGLLGYMFNAQCLVLVPGANALGLTASNALSVNIGNGPKCVAFSAGDIRHASLGNDALLAYDATALNEGGAWIGRSSFIAPVTGIYYFFVSGVKDSFEYGGTQDDVYIVLKRNGSAIDSAWSGEGDGRRGTLELSTAALLYAGDRIETFAASDSGRQRHLAKFEVSGFLVNTRPAFAVTGANHASLGNPTKLTYSTRAAQGRGWDGSSTFVAPVAGPYFFAITGVKDAYANGGTEGDVYVLLRRGTEDVGYAWSGSTGGRRDSMGFTTILNLQAGEEITTWASTSGLTETRHLAKYEFTGFLLDENTDVAVQGSEHSSVGNNVTMRYQSVSSNNGGGWVGPSTFFAPTTGVYFLAITAVKDAYYHGGTQDDVYMFLRRNGDYLGHGWSGEGTGMRGGLAYSTMLRLNAGDRITTLAGSDNGLPRHLAKYELSGFKLSD